MKKPYLQITDQFHFCMHISKIFEKVIFKQLYQYFQEKQLYNAQYGFRTDHSTEFATLELIDRVIVEMDKNNTPLNIFLDLSKSFDTLDHKILLKKLNYYVIQSYGELSNKQKTIFRYG